LALALSASTDKSQVDQAIVHVERAMEVLNKCKKNLLEKLTSVQETYGKGKQVAKSDDNTEDIEKKLNEIDQFLVEMEAKVSLIYLFIYLFDYFNFCYLIILYLKFY
jgi:prefoldin subunit 5